MSKEAVAAVREPETKQEQLARLKKSVAKKENSLVIQIMESDWYDFNPGARFLLVVIALGTRSNPDAYLPDDMPGYMKEDKCIGWCDMSQWKLGLRVGKSESQIQRDIKRFRKDGVIQARGWTDENEAEHLMYRIVPGNELSVIVHLLVPYCPRYCYEVIVGRLRPNVSTPAQLDEGRASV